MIICVKNSTRIFSDSKISGLITWSLSRNKRQIETHKKVQHQVYCYVWSTKRFRLDTEPFEHSIYGYGGLLVWIVCQANAIRNTDKNLIQTLHQTWYGIIYEYWQIPLKFSNCCKYELTSFDGPFCCSTGIFRYQAKMIMNDFNCCKRNNIVITKSRVKPQPNTFRNEKTATCHIWSLVRSVFSSVKTKRVYPCWIFKKHTWNRWKSFDDELNGIATTKGESHIYNARI